MSKAQRKLIFIFSLIIGGLLIVYSFYRADPWWVLEGGLGLFKYLRSLLRLLVKQPTLYIGIAIIGIGIFIFQVRNMTSTKLKKLIAREGLILLGIVVFSIVFRKFGLHSDAPLRTHFIIFYSFYLFIRFVVWAINTLRRKEEQQ